MRPPAAVTCWRGGLRSRSAISAPTLSSAAGCRSRPASYGRCAVGCGPDAGAPCRTRALAAAATRCPSGVMTDYDHASIDEILHSRVRLAIVAFLAGAKTAEFSAVRDAIRTTDGNASVHLRKLE